MNLPIVRDCIGTEAISTFVYSCGQRKTKNETFEGLLLRFLTLLDPQPETETGLHREKDSVRLTRILEIWTHDGEKG